MKIAIVGTGYVGLVTGACLADTGNEVWCVDKNGEKIARLLDGRIPIYEPGLEGLVLRGLREERLQFTTDLPRALQNAEICFLTVDTPSGPNGVPDLTNVFDVAQKLGDAITGPLLVVTKSTVPVGTTLKVKQQIGKKLAQRGLDPSLVSIASNPEFLKEGTSVQDFRNPDRVVVGAEMAEAAEQLRELYAPFMRKRDCFLVMDIASAELAKYASNAMLATRISFMNEMAGLCEAIGADIDKVRQAVGWDPRIGSHFLYPGLGYGGSCLPKDVLALVELGKQKEAPLPLIQAVETTNRAQREKFFRRVARYFGSTENLKEKTFALWGLSFKPETDDIRQAPSLFLIENLLKHGAKIRAFDPVAMENVRSIFGDAVLFCANNYLCLEGADCLLIATEWNEFRSPDFAKMRRLMKKPVIFDGRNLYPPSKMEELGFDYASIGR